MPRDKNIFTLNPTSLDMRRSVFNRPSQLKTSFNLGDIIPIYLDEILPGDTVTMDLAHVIRMGTPIAPIMDNIYADVYFFFVPNRLVWSHWEQFCGANDTTAWTQTNSYTIPQCNWNPSNASVGCLGDYFGIPQLDNTIVKNTLKVSELPLRAYYKIYNDWFRDENSIAPVLYTIGDTANSGIWYGGYPKKVSRFHDLFSSCLPGPQKGGSVELPLGSLAPVIPGANHLIGKAASNMSWADVAGSTAVLAGSGTVGSNSGDARLSSGTAPTGSQLAPANLYADLSTATAATVNEVRMAFQLQRLLEKDARGGTRYQELLLSHFGVRGSDARLQRAEYLAGKRFRINIDQVVATADTGSSQSETLGNTGAVSKTTCAASLFTKSFTEHGMLIGLVVLRQDHTYSEGIERYWSKKDRFDFYYPALANIGEVPVYKSELSLRSISSSAIDLGEKSGVFGYQEAWYEYRFKPSRCTGFMNPAVSNSLNYWTLGDVYSTAPSLNATFLEETPLFLDRALAVSSSLTHQFIADFYFKPRFSRVMPLYSIPGLIDHH